MYKQLQILWYNMKNLLCILSILLAELQLQNHRPLFSSSCVHVHKAKSSNKIHLVELQYCKIFPKIRTFESNSQYIRATWKKGAHFMSRLLAWLLQLFDFDSSSLTHFLYPQTCWKTFVSSSLLSLFECNCIYKWHCGPAYTESKGMLSDFLYN